MEGGIVTTAPPPLGGRMLFAPAPGRKEVQCSVDQDEAVVSLFRDSVIMHEFSFKTVHKVLPLGADGVRLGTSLGEFTLRPLPEDYASSSVAQLLTKCLDWASFVQKVPRESFKTERTLGKGVSRLRGTVKRLSDKMIVRRNSGQNMSSPTMQPMQTTLSRSSSHGSNDLSSGGYKFYANRWNPVHLEANDDDLLIFRHAEDIQPVSIIGLSIIVRAELLERRSPRVGFSGPRVIELQVECRNYSKHLFGFDTAEVASLWKAKLLERSAKEVSRPKFKMDQTKGELQGELLVSEPKRDDNQRSRFALLDSAIMQWRRGERDNRDQGYLMLNSVKSFIDDDVEWTGVTPRGFDPLLTFHVEMESGDMYHFAASNALEKEVWCLLFNKHLETQPSMKRRFRATTANISARLAELEDDIFGSITYGDDTKDELPDGGISQSMTSQAGEILAEVDYLDSDDAPQEHGDQTETDEDESTQTLTQLLDDYEGQRLDRSAARILLESSLRKSNDKQAMRLTLTRAADLHARKKNPNAPVNAQERMRSTLLLRNLTAELQEEDTPPSSPAPRPPPGRPKALPVPLSASTKSKLARKPLPAPPESDEESD